MLSRLRIGHVGLANYMNRFNMSDSNQCNKCLVPETVEHFMLICPQYNTEREQLKRKLKQIKTNQITVKLLLGGDTAFQCLNKTILKLTSEYLVSTSRLDTLHINKQMRFSEAVLSDVNIRG